MSTREPQPQRDEFDAFLQGEDELSLLLRELPQLSPSASLDAAVRADAERAAERNRTPLPMAANDAVVPESARIRQPSFAGGWQIPLGLAVSALIVAPLFLLRPHAPADGKPANRASASAEMTIVMPHIPPLREQGKTSADAVPYPAAPPRLQPAYVPPPDIAVPETPLLKSQDNPAPGGENGPQASTAH